ncbi:MAG: phosphoheptose isomerase [Deltaproteobacteria bacterium]|nr:MAG: phosphoheptose isomerase [Deltaproteobacteria bacterium]
MERIIEENLSESLKVAREFIRKNKSSLILLARKIADAFIADCKLLICGNGGSAADAQHMAAEFVNRYRLERPPLPAMALTTDASVITSIGNDYSFDDIFSKQVKALGMEGDVLLAISTSGNSENVLRAVRDARRAGMFTAALTGNGGGRLAKLADLALVVGSDVTPRIQESHLFAEHMVCHLVDYLVFQQHSEAG